MPIRLYIYLAIALALLSAGGYTTYRWMEAENLKVQQERDNALAAAAGQAAIAAQLQGDFDASEEIARKRGLALAAATRKADLFERALGGLNSAPALAWKGSPVPIDVRQLRRTDAGCPPDLQLPCPAGASTGDRGALDERRSEPGASVGGLPPTSESAPLQRGQGVNVGVRTAGGGEGTRRVATLEVVEPSKNSVVLRDPKEPKEPRQ